MGKLLDRFWGNRWETYKQLVANNRKAVDEYNQKMMSVLSLMGWVLMLLPLLAVPFSNTKEGALPAYLLAFACYFILFFFLSCRL